MITSFQCSLCKVIIYAKKNKRDVQAENSLFLFHEPRGVYREETLVTVSPCGFPLNCSYFKLFFLLSPCFFLLSAGWAGGVLSEEK